MIDVLSASDAEDCVNSGDDSTQPALTETDPARPRQDSELLLRLPYSVFVQSSSSASLTAAGVWRKGL